MDATWNYHNGKIRIFQPYEDLIVSLNLSTNVITQWPIIQREEISDITVMLDSWIPLGEVIGPEVSMEAIEEGRYHDEIRPQLEYDHSMGLTVSPTIVQTIIKETNPVLPIHIVRILLEKAAADKSTCPISGELITPVNGSVTHCGHLFEKTALKSWMARSPTCPECRCKI